MKTKIALSAIVAAVAVFSQGAFAQTSSSTPVEAHGQAGADQPMRPMTHSTKTRAERKARTKAALKAGHGVPKGQAGSMKSQNTGGSDKTLSKGEVQTKDALKAGKGEPTGQAQMNVPENKPSK